MRDLYRAFSLLGKKIVPVFLISFLTALVVAFNFNIVLAFIAKDVLDASVSGNRDLLMRALLMASVCFAVGLPVLAGGSYLVKAYIKKMMTTTRVGLFSRMLSIPVGMLEGQHSGDTLSRMTNDLGQIKKVFEMTMNSLFVALTMGSMGIISIFIMDWRLGLAALALGFSLLAASIFLSRPIRRANDAVQVSLGLQTERLTDLMESLAVAKLYHAEDRVLSRYKDASKAWERNRGRSALYKSVFDALNTALEWISRVGLLILG